MPITGWRTFTVVSGESVATMGWKEKNTQIFTEGKTRTCYSLSIVTIMTKAQTNFEMVARICINFLCKIIQNHINPM
jgi:hypothetical protein